MNELLTKARKPHRCDLCREIIAKGELYNFHRITPWDHPDNEGFGNYRAHQACNDLWAKTGQENDWLLPEPGEFERPQ